MGLPAEAKVSRALVRRWEAVAHAGTVAPDDVDQLSVDMGEAKWAVETALRPFVETLALIDRENTLEPGSHNLNVRSIARVLRAWGDFEGETWAGGFVLELRDGRRVYAESYADGPDWGSDSCVSVVAVPTDSLLPRLPKNHDSKLYGWVEDLPELSDYLRRLGCAS